MKKSLELMAEIESRNLFRQQSGLPSPQVEEEVERLVHIEQQREFDIYFRLHRHRFEHLYHPKNGRGHLANMGIWQTVRRFLHAEMMISRLQENGL